MGEVFTFSEGRLYIWTGSHTASGMSVAFVEQVSVNLTTQWGNQRSVGTGRHEWVIDQRADLQIGKAYANADLYALLNATGVVHIKVEHENVPAGSAGFILYSGRLDNLSVNGSQGAIMQENLVGHAYQWTGY